MFWVDALRISGRNIKIHSRRSLMVVATMGMIFGLIFTMNLFLCGIRNSYMNLANDVAGNKVIIVATNNEVNAYNEGSTVEVDRADIVYDIEKYGGRVIGDTRRFGMFGTVIIPEELVKESIEINLDNAPRDAVPVLVNAFLGEQLLKNDLLTTFDDMNKKIISYEKYRSEILGRTFEDVSGAKYYVVGLVPGSYHVSNLSFRQIQANNDNLLNLLLERILVTSGVPTVIDNERDEEWQNEYISSETDFGIVSVVAVFDDNATAYEYFMNGNGVFPNISLADKTYSVTIMSGVSPEISFTFNWFETIANMVSIVLCVIASIVVIFTSVRLVDQDRQNVALYYSLGATPRQIKIIYLFYFLELMLGALVFAFTLASIVIIIFNLSEQELLSAQAMLSFNLPNRPHVVWYGMDMEAFIASLIMLVLPLLCVAVNSKKMRR